MTDPLSSNGFEPRFLAEALVLASTSTTRTSPNPRVGCVIVKNGVVVGRGVTRVPGQAHAEVVAIADAGSDALKMRLWSHGRFLCEKSHFHHNNL